MNTVYRRQIRKSCCQIPIFHIPTTNLNYSIIIINFHHLENGSARKIKCTGVLLDVHLHVKYCETFSMTFGPGAFYSYQNIDSVANNCGIQTTCLYLIVNQHLLREAMSTQVLRHTWKRHQYVEKGVASDGQMSCDRIT